MRVQLRGTSEAILASESCQVHASAGTTVSDVTREIAGRSPELARVLLTSDGNPRNSTKVLLDGVVPEWSSPVHLHSEMKLISTLPCDG